MTKKEIMSYQGHEFTYVFEDGSTMPAYIKKIDLKEEKLSYWSFSLITDQGHEFEPLEKEEEIENACCLGFKDSLPGIIELLTEIKTIGKVVYNSNPDGCFFGCPL